jgi:hypothetical protein
MDKVFKELSKMENKALENIIIPMEIYMMDNGKMM